MVVKSASTRAKIEVGQRHLPPTLFAPLAENSSSARRANMNKAKSPYERNFHGPSGKRSSQLATRTYLTYLPQTCGPIRSHALRPDDGSTQLLPYSNSAACTQPSMLVRSAYSEQRPPSLEPFKRTVKGNLKGIAFSATAGSSGDLCGRLTNRRAPTLSRAIILATWGGCTSFHSGESEMAPVTIDRRCCVPLFRAQ